MNDQENLEEGLDFDLDSILSEFGSGAQSQEAEAPQKEPEAPEATQESETDLPDLSGFDLPDLDLPTVQAPQAEEEPSAPPVSDEAFSDEEFARQLDALLGDTPNETPEPPQGEGDLEDTQVFSPVSESPKEAQNDTAATQRLDTVSQIPQPETPPEPKKEPIPFRANLQELKRKLVAGPEKRYYELSDQGVLKLQIAILLNLLVVGVCAATAGHVFHGPGAGKPAAAGDLQPDFRHAGVRPVGQLPDAGRCCGPAPRKIYHQLYAGAYLSGLRRRFYLLPEGAPGALLRRIRPGDDLCAAGQAPPPVHGNVPDGYSAPGHPAEQHRQRGGLSGWLRAAAGRRRRGRLPGHLQ